MEQDTWEVRVMRPHGPEFQAWEGSDEADAREQYQMWKEDENVSKVGLFINGEWAEPAYQRRGPGRPPKALSERHVAITISLSHEAIEYARSQGMTISQFVERLIKEHQAQTSEAAPS